MMITLASAIVQITWISLALFSIECKRKIAPNKNLHYRFVGYKTPNSTSSLQMEKTYHSVELSL